MRPLALALLGMTACVSSRDTALAGMKKALGEVRSGPATVFTEHWEERLDPRPLVGLSRKEIEGALGPRADCPSSGFRSRFEYSCDAYRFYNLPAGAGGGGPNLEIYSDGYGICVRTLWAITM